ncbi:MAG: WecB/TagA/CpsF family glycosyltransferase [Pseudomonadota bacterium]
MRFHLSGTTIAVNMHDAPMALSAVAERLRAGEGFALATLNLDHVVKLRRAPAFRAAYAAQDLVTADGNPIVWLSRLAGAPAALAPGSDLVVPLCRLAAELGRPVGFLGSTAGTLAQAERALGALVPGLEIRARIAPGFDFDPLGAEAAEHLAALEAAGVALCFLALGAPKQEMLAARARQVAPSLGLVSVGAGLDFLAAPGTRAPAWMRRMALEWAWRLLRDPGRLAGRYLACFAILPGLIRAALIQRAATRAP